MSSRSHGIGFIVMPVYKPEPELLRRQLQSLRAQSETHWACLIGLDGSDDTAADLVAGLVLGDGRFRVRVYDDNVGVYRHVERLLADTPPEAAWVALADQDDEWYPFKLRVLLARLTAGATVVSGQARVVDADRRVLGSTERRGGSLVDLLLRNQITGSLTVYQPEVVRRALPFPAATSIAVHDHWLAVVAAALGRVDVLDVQVQDYVQHGANVLGESPGTSVRSEWRAARARGGVRTHLTWVSDQQWGWRVNMAQSLRSVVGASPEPAVLSIASGRFDSAVRRAVRRSVLHRRLGARRGVGTLVAAWWWGRCHA